ncbi:MAG: hemolysin III family protein [Gaiellaceae bacterium]
MLVLAGGGLYSLGALAYVLRRPDPAPAVFGYHEVFHLLVIAGGGSPVHCCLFVVLGAA